MLDISEVKKYIGYVWVKQAEVESERIGGPTFEQFKKYVMSCKKKKKQKGFCKTCIRFPCWKEA